MRSKKNLVIGFLLLFLGIGLSEYSLPLSILAGVAGIVMMILYAAGNLKREDSETKVLPEQRHGEIENLQCALHPVSTQSVESKKVQVNEKSDPLVRRSEVEQSEKQGAPSSPETAEIYQRLIGQYSQIVNADCFGTLAQIETKMQQCTAFLENWMTALGNKEFVLLLYTYAKYNSALHHFYLPQTGAYRMIQIDSSESTVPDGLTNAIVKKIQGKQKGLQNFWEAQKWFEDLIPALRPFDLIVNKNAEQLKRRTGIEPAKTSNVTSRTPLAKFNDFYAIDLETTGLSEVKNEIIQIAIIKFHHFQPVEILSSYVKPRKGLKREAAAINHITEDMVADAPYIEQIMQSVDAFIGEKAPIIAHNLQFEYKFLAANGSENIVKKRSLYDTLELSKRIWQLESYSLENVCRNTFKFTPALHNAESDALTCGLLFREICNKRIGVPEVCYD